MTSVPFGLFCYLVVVLAYAPWGWLAVTQKWIFRFPVVSFCYFGLLSQNALGSFLVIFPGIADRTDYFTIEYVGMLLAQALIFYVVTLPYLASAPGLSRRIDGGARSTYRTLAPDRIMILITIAAALLVVVRYSVSIGTPPLLLALTGELNGLDLIEYRVSQTYGLDNYSNFHIGITVLPMFFTVLGLFMHLSTGRYRYLLPIPLGLFISALPGGKGSFVDVASIVFVGYLLYGWYSGRSPPRLGANMRSRTAFIWSVVALLPVLGMYRIYYQDQSLANSFGALLYRLFGVNSESMAAAVHYVESVGLLGGQSLPNVRGLLRHDVVNLPRAMHDFMFGPGGGAPLSWLAEGYINFGWTGFVIFGAIGFIIVLIVDAVMSRQPRSGFNFAILMVAVVFATKLAQTSIVATFVSLTYAGLYVVLALMNSFLRIGFHSVRSRALARGGGP